MKTKQTQNNARVPGSGVSISRDTHIKLKVFCNQHGYKINAWVSQLIDREIEKQTLKKNNKRVIYKNISCEDWIDEVIKDHNDRATQQINKGE